jgi:putative ABC transport system permease protein
VARGDHVALINETASKLWPAGEDPIGKLLRIDLLLTKPGPPRQVLALPGGAPDVPIAGIVGDTRNAGLRNATQPAVFVPYILLAPPSRVLAVRTFGDPMGLLNAIRRQVQEMDKDMPLGRPVTSKEVLGGQTAQPRFTMALFSCFAGLGLALAAAGIYSVITYHVTQRVHEIGVRIALGARGGDILTMVLGMGARVVSIGLAIGLGGSVLFVRILRTQIFAAASFDEVAVAGVGAAPSVVAAVACYVPAQRAAKMDPVTALRHEG